MTQVDFSSILVPRPTVSSLPTIPEPDGAIQKFGRPHIRANASVTLVGGPGEPLAGWKLGYFQLQLVETNYSRYRGRSVRDGSALSTLSHHQLLRDTDELAPDLWFDPPGRGDFESFTPVVPGGAVIPATGRFPMEAKFSDTPGEAWVIKLRNELTRQDNFLHHTEIGFQFCTMVVAQDAGGRFLVLKHFYWSAQWEAHFHPDGSGKPVLARINKLQLNVQHTVHSGVSSDPRFKGRELDRGLPIANKLASRRPIKRFSFDWKLS